MMQASVSEAASAGRPDSSLVGQRAGVLLGPGCVGAGRAAGRQTCDAGARARGTLDLPARLTHQRRRPARPTTGPTGAIDEPDAEQNQQTRGDLERRRLLAEEDRGLDG